MITMGLFDKQVPKTLRTSRSCALARAASHKGSKFHRVIPNHAQGGTSPTATVSAASRPTGESSLTE